MYRGLLGTYHQIQSKKAPEKSGKKIGFTEKNGPDWANREVKHKVSGSIELMNWVRNRGENNYIMLEGGINRDLDEISIKGTRGGWGKESN